MKRSRKEKHFYVADTENTVPKSTLYDSDNIDDLEVTESYYKSCVPEPLTEFQSEEDDSETHVWAAATCPVKIDCDEDDVEVYTSIEDWIKSTMHLESNPIIYFHNAAYDFPLVLQGLVRMGFTETMNGMPETQEETEIIEGLFDEADKIEAVNKKFAEDIRNQAIAMREAIDVRLNKRTPEDGEYMVMMSGDGLWYSLKYKHKHNHKCVELRDSLKILPFSVNKIAKDFKTRYQKLKGTIDYTKERPVGYFPDETEIKYLKNDVLVMSEALAMLKDDGVLEYLTIGSHCMADFKQRVGKSVFKILYPQIDVDLDKELRKAYRGGWCYNNTNGEIYDFRGTNNRIYTYDVNSLYPSVMRNVANRYPIGEAKHFDGCDFDSNKDKEYFVKINVAFTIKPKHLPFVQIKNSRWADNEYIKDSDGVVELTFTKPDFELFQEQYDIEYLEIVEGWSFVSETGGNLFGKYIDYWYAKKANAKTPAERQLAKLMLNNLYGKFATAIFRKSAYPYFGEDGLMHTKIVENQTRGGYIAIGAYITSYAKGVTIRAAQANYDNFKYSDTDSIHLIDKAVGIKVDSKEIGAWALESESDMARFIRQKTYVEHIVVADGVDVEPHWSIRACGCPEEVKERLLYKVTDTVIKDNNVEYIFHKLVKDEDEHILNERRNDDEFIKRFTYGLVEAGKLSKKRVTGGVVLCETTFAIRKAS